MLIRSCGLYVYSAWKNSNVCIKFCTAGYNLPSPDQLVTNSRFVLLEVDFSGCCAAQAKFLGKSLICLHYHNALVFRRRAMCERVTRCTYSDMHPQMIYFTTRKRQKNPFPRTFEDITCLIECNGEILFNILSISSTISDMGTVPKVGPLLRFLCIDVLLHLFV